MSQLPVAVQLYTLREDCAADFPGTLAKVAEIGYKHVELAGFNGHSAADVSKILGDLGLTAISAHESLDTLESDGAEAALDNYVTVGATTVIVPFLQGDRREDAAGYTSVAKALEVVAKKAADRGLKFAYHNHDFEFTQKFDGVSGFDILLNESDPVLLFVELDTYWALYAGVDPVEFINAHAGRISHLHIKDMDPVDRSFAPVGTGLLPLDAIIAAAPGAGVKALVVEQDVCKLPPLESITISFNNLKAKGYV